MSDATTTAPAPKPCTSYVREAFCTHCEGMVNGNGCGGYKEKDGTPMPCPVSGQTPTT
jgi:hypothetical protein